MLNHTLKVFDYNINLIASTPRWQKSVEKNIRSYFVLLKTFTDRYQDISPAVEYSASFWCFQNNYGQCCKVFFFRVPFCSPSPLKTSLTKSNIWKKKILRSEVSASLAQCSISMPLKKLYMVGVQLSQGYRATQKRQFTFYHQVPSNSCNTFDQPRKNERLSWSCSHPMVLSPGRLDWESSAVLKVF